MESEQQTQQDKKNNVLEFKKKNKIFNKYKKDKDRKDFIEKETTDEKRYKLCFVYNDKNIILYFPIFGDYNATVDRDSMLLTNKDNYFCFKYNNGYSFSIEYFINGKKDRRDFNVIEPEDNNTIYHRISNNTFYIFVHGNFDNDFIEFLRNSNVLTE